MLLGYCMNVHAGESLACVAGALRRFVGPVRRELGWDRMGAGLWLSREAVSTSGAAKVLRRALDEQELFAFTMNGFPMGGFHEERVKRRVYHPDWAASDRVEYTLALARTLSELLGDESDHGTISTLPLGHRNETPADALDTALDNVARTAAALAGLEKRIVLGFEPEPGCWLETSADSVRVLGERLEERARKLGIPRDVVRRHVGVCFDTCHHAVAFEEPSAALADLAATGVAVAKVQISSALRVPDPSSSLELIQQFDEPRYLHQVRARLDDGTLAEADDLDDLATLPTDREWRIHFHVPVHRAIVGTFETTRDTIPRTLRALEALGSGGPLPHLEVETYTWSVLPGDARPTTDEDLVRGLAAELAWTREQLP